MKQFEVGKTYITNCPGYIQITKRTEKYISFVYVYRGIQVLKGRKLINQDDLCGLGEHIIINTKCEESKINVKIFCFAGLKCD